MHAWIRCFELVIHVAYRLEVMQWQMKTAAAKETVKAKKKDVQRIFRKQLGLVVDKLRAGSKGASNDGNTARRLFCYPVTFGAITGVDEHLIVRLAVILEALQTCQPLDPDRYAQYAMDTAEMFVQLYPWFYNSGLPRCTNCSCTVRLSSGLSCSRSACTAKRYRRAVTNIIESTGCGTPGKRRAETPWWINSTTYSSPVSQRWHKSFVTWKPRCANGKCMCMVTKRT